MDPAAAGLKGPPHARRAGVSILCLPLLRGRTFHLETCLQNMHHEVAALYAVLRVCASRFSSRILLIAYDHPVFLLHRCGALCSVTVHLHLNRRLPQRILPLPGPPGSAGFRADMRAQGACAQARPMKFSNVSAKLLFTSKGVSYSTFDVTRHRSSCAEVSSDFLLSFSSSFLTLFLS